MNKVLVPPIKSQGIKTKLVPWIQKALSWDKKGVWIEPFMGTGVVGFNIAAPQASFSDTNPHLIAFYQALQNQQITPAIAKNYLEYEGAEMLKKGGEHYYEVRNRFNQYHHPLDFLFLNRSCFNGMIRFNGKGGFNVPWGRKSARFAKAYIAKIANQISWVQKVMLNSDWQFSVAEFSGALDFATEEDFIYCDPPYIDRHADYFNGWDEHSERQLFSLLKSTNARFLLSTWHSNKYRQNEYISGLWSQFAVLTKEHFYHVGAREGNRNSMQEALVANYPVAITEARNSEQLVLLKEREVTVHEG